MGAEEQVSTSVDGLTKQWADLKSSDEARQRLIEHLFDELKLAHSNNDKLQEEIDTLKLHERNFVREIKEVGEEKKDLSTRLRSIEQESPFLLVLIDGDNTHFNDEFVRAGAEGGYMAAQKLHQAVSSHMSGLQGGSQSKVVIRIYTNMFGLCGAYEKAEVSLGAQVVRAFIGGFNRELPLAEFVDVGNDKEAADHKIRENLALYWSNQHCKHIMLAASADRGYVSFLRQFSTASANERLTLVESIPFPKDFQTLAARFKQIRFPDVFRNEKIVCTPHPGSRATESIANYAAAAANTSHKQSSTQSAVVSSKHQVHASTQKGPPLQFNKSGQRIDPQLPWYNKNLMSELSSKKLCGRHFLTRCTASEADCPYGLSHDGELSTAQRIVLTRIARHTPCENGTGCHDVDCVAGHQCLYDGHCDYANRCRFGGDMHGVDKTPVSRK